MVSPQLLAVARGDIPADLVLKGARIVNVFSGEIEAGDIAIAGERIAGVGHGYEGRETIDLAGAYVSAGLIDAHVHIESSLCLPGQFAAAVTPRGVTTAVADPHEIANVCGAPGVRFMHDASRGLPLRVVLMAPSCVPATDMATSGAALGADELAELLRDGAVHGLAEVMNFPGVIGGDAGVVAKLDAFAGRMVDGHAPSVRGKSLSAYVAAGVGSDHECVTVDEAKEKLARGLYILIREATNAHNLDALLPLVNEKNSRRICFCTDDRQPADLLGEGSVDFMIRRAIEFGIEPVTAFRMATLNAAEWFGLHDRGAVSPGRLADLMVFDDLRKPTAKVVFAGGQRVEAGSFARAAARVPEKLTRTVNVDWSKVNLRVAARSGKIRVIESLADQLITRMLLEQPSVREGFVVADTSRDLLKMAVIERHSGSSRAGVGFIRGFGFKAGAIAGTVAHDHHNLVVIGCDDASMLLAAKAVGETQGGYAVARDGRVLATLRLPIAGLMSDEPIKSVAHGYDALLAGAKAIGSVFRDPFMAMSFMALEVIPSLKLTDRGLVDVDTFKRVELFA